jgi:hypothetical protein
MHFIKEASFQYRDASGSRIAGKGAVVHLGGRDIRKQHDSRKCQSVTSMNIVPMVSVWLQFIQSSLGLLPLVYVGEVKPSVL